KRLYLKYFHHPLNMNPLQFGGGDPGAVLHGNFINYYDFHPPEERLRLLPESPWLERENRQLVFLDIGCNTGALTTRLHEKLSQSIKKEASDGCYTLGIDIDPVLIERARELNSCPDQITFECMDFMSERGSEVFKEHLSKCRGQFDVIFCFSVTMWIHLNHGDDGLKRFLQDISDMAKIIVIEPQPWKCYKSAVKRLKRCHKTFPFFEKLTIRDQVEQFIEEFLLKTCSFTKIHESSETKWGRKLIFFKKPQNRVDR
ncbi:putative RNA methyltransferase, partial [Frankliniella fusca]